MKLVTKIYIKGALLVVIMTVCIWNLSLPDWAVPILIISPMFGFAMANRRELIESLKEDEATK
jgi:hypothetical protein